MSTIRAVTIDFYETLVETRGGVGRGARFQQYLEEQDLTARPWEHRFLYELFPLYAESYRPDLTAAEKEAFWAAFSERLFGQTEVRGPGRDDFERHAPVIARIFGSSALCLYPDAIPCLETLATGGIPVGIISNWPPGLQHFCAELGIAPHVRFILGSADFGCEKPAPAIFEAAAQQLQLDPCEILHVGDTIVDDVEGALACGFQALHLARPHRHHESTGVPAIPGLDALPAMITG